MIVAAPAGYGKTSLLIDFAYQTQIPVCWFSIDSLDSDPKRFIAHFISAIASVFPAFGDASISALKNLDQDSMNLEPVISAIINDVYDHITEHFVFVLDDYHLVRESKLIDEFINHITMQMSENCHLVIASRTLLTLPDLTVLVARSQVGGLSYEELAFLPEEIKQLFAVNYHQTLTEKASSDLVDQTEGWITGLLLTAQLSPTDTSNRLRLARVSGIGIYEYLAQQVLRQQPDSLVLFLKRTSLMEEFDAEMCSKVFSQIEGIQEEDWQQKIETLLRENLFVLPLDDETLHLRYHHLFSEFLQNSMRTERPDESRLIEYELVKLYEERKEWERAFSILARIGTVEQIAAYIQRAAPSMILGGRLSALSKWLELLPEERRSSSPELLSIRGTISMVQGDLTTSLQYLDLAIDGLRTKQNENELARALIRRSSLYRLNGTYDKAIADAKEATALCERLENSTRLFAEALRSLGIAMFQSGDLKNAKNTLISSLDKYKLLDEEMDAAKVLLDLGLVHLTLGELHEAEEAYQKSLEYWQRTQNFLWQAHLLNNIGMVQHSLGKYEQAVISFEKAISQARMASNPRVEGFLLTSLGDLYRDIGALKEARQAYQLADASSRNTDDQALHIFLTLSESSLERLIGNNELAHVILDDALIDARNGGSKYETNLCILEQCALHLREKKLNDLELKLDHINRFFLGEGFHMEELRSRYYLLLVKMLLSPVPKNEKEFVVFFESALSGNDRFYFIHFAAETIQLLKEYDAREETRVLEPLIQVLNDFIEEQTSLRKMVRRHSRTIQFALPKYVIRALGRSQVRIGDHIVPLSEWKTQTVRDLFFFILVNQDGVTKEEIGEAFWPDSTLDSIRVRFKNSIYRLRHALGSETISFIDDVYRFNRLTEYDFDLENFSQEVSLAQNTADEIEKIQHYRQAIANYRGNFLPKTDCDWVIIKREQLHSIFLTAIKQLLALLFKTGQHQLVIQYADRAIEEDHCYEEAYRMAMQAFSKLGDRAAVSRYYDKCIQSLSKELDIKPDPQTIGVYHQLIQ